jgi:putative aldouronate transport system substrate-binding protein
MNYATKAVGEDNPVWVELEKRTNTDLKITWLPSASFEQKMTMLLASKDLPDLTFVTSLNMPILRELISEGAFWDLTPYIQRYPHLSALPRASWDNSMLEGKHYAVPRYYPITGGEQFPMLRKDWLDRLKLKPPETMDELYRTLYAFTYQDPDHNGKQDTIGYTGYFSSLQFVFNTFNETGGAWKLKDGKLHPILTEPASRDALLWIKKAYDENIIDPGFAILKLTQMEEAMKRGTAGSTALSMGFVWKFIEELRRSNPKADLLPLSYLRGPTGAKYVPATEGFFGAYLIPKSVPEEKLLKLLAFLDYGYSPEGNDLVNFGIEGVHYTVKDGMKVATERAHEDSVIIGDNLGSIWRPLGNTQVVSAIGISPEVYERNKQVVVERDRSIPPNPGSGLYSAAYSEEWSKINAAIGDLRIRVILGQVSIEYYDEQIGKLKNDPKFNRIVRAFNELYQVKMKAAHDEP